MCGCIRTQGDQAEVGTFINEASVFESSREVSGEFVVNAATILEHRFRLRTRSRGECTQVLGGNKSQCACPPKHIGLESPEAWNRYHKSSRRAAARAFARVGGQPTFEWVGVRK